MASQSHGRRLRFKSDIEKGAVISNFERRGWVRANDEEWNIYWASVHSVRVLFNPDNGYRLNDNQIINHYPNHYELTRKDSMVKNIKRFRKDMEKEGLYVEEFVPVTYSLPADYSMFVEEFRRNPNSVWIMKPPARARGIGIFMINKLSQIKKWASTKFSSVALRDSYIISRYIENPLLIGGKKFDLRLYVLVTSYRPLRAYIHREGFARFCVTKYSMDLSALDDVYMHLTNVAIQKHHEEYNSDHGNKWSLKNLRLWLEGVYGHERTVALFQDMQAIAINSLRAVQPVIINDKHCFEIYGYDLMVDSNLKAWLIEVNASPALTATTHSDRIMKYAVLNDAFDVIVPPEGGDGVGKSAYAPPVVGGFELLVDETDWEGEAARKTAGRPSSATQQWR